MPKKNQLVSSTASPMIEGENEKQKHGNKISHVYTCIYGLPPCAVTGACVYR